MTDDGQTPWERMQAANEAQALAHAASFERAIRDTYSIVKVSPRRWAVAKRMSHTIRGLYGVKDLINWETVTAPISWEDASKELVRLRGERGR